MQYLVYLYYPLLIILLIKGAKIYKAGAWNDEFLSRGQMKAVQGFCAIAIMFHHMAQKTCAPWLKEAYIVHGLDFFVPVGYLLVAIFFFCSGYGLCKSYQEKENYLYEFGWKRVLPIVIPFFLTSVIYLDVRTKMGEDILANWLNINIRFGEPQMFNMYGWFVYALFVVYFGFWLWFRKERKKGRSITVFLLVIAAYIAFCHWWMYGGWWYNTIWLAPVGVLTATYETGIVTRLKKNYKCFLPVCWGIFAALFWVAFKNETQSYAVWLQMLAAGFFVLCVMMTGLKVQIGNKVLSFLGGFTLEIYLIHGLFVQLFGYCFASEGIKPLYYIKNVAFYVLVVVLLTIPSACAVKWICKQIYRFLNWKKDLSIDIFQWTLILLFGLVAILVLMGVYLGFSSRKQSEESAHLIEEYAREHITYVTVDDKKMAAYVTGEGAHTLIMLGDATEACPTMALRPLADFLAEDCKIVILDSFGRGFSEDTEEVRDAEHMAEEAHQAIEALGVEKPYVLVPHGSAGIYAQRYLQMYPEEVEGMIGLDSWIPDQYKEMLRLSNQTEKAYVRMQKKGSDLSYYGIKIGEAVCGLSRSIWYSMERNHVFLEEDERLILGEIATKKYANRNALDEALYYYGDAKEMFGQTYPDDFPVMFFLSYVSNKYTYRDIGWERLHKKTLSNPQIQGIKILEGNTYMPYYKCEYLKKEILLFLEQMDARR